jgi:DNA-binding CsgD family transcriptional regulator
MFKLGGQADQGTGIMSHVEPRQNYMFGNVAQPLTPFQDTYTELPAYAMGGRIGYAQAGPVQVSDPFTYFAPNKNLPGTLPTVTNPLLEQRRKFDEEQRAIQQANREQLGIASVKIKGTPFFARSAQEQELYDKGYLTEGMTATEKKKAMERLNLARKSTREEDVAAPIETKVLSKKPATKEAGDTDPRNEIRREADLLKGLLKDEGLTTAENAFIVAKALATPGGFNAKVAAAANLAMPIIKERSKLDRDITLEAYKTSKEMEKARIAAGKLDPAARFTEDYVENKIRVAQESKDGVIQGEDGITRYRVGNEYKTRSEIERDFLNVRGGIVPPAMRAELSQRISDTERQLRILSNQKQSEEIKKQIEIKQEQIKKDKALLRGEFKTGGRVQKQFGGMMDTTEDATMKEAEETNTIVDTNVAGTPMKPVQKLTYEEIRNRLPQEITDDIVKLISNSAEALQDFAYIKTQQDVNQFNIKYGVNLVLPQGA